jgi:Porin subfamily
MKMVKSLLLGSAAGLVAVAGAQAADLPVKAKPVQYVKICSLYGVGFYYIPGTDMCIKIGGWVRAEAAWNVNGSSTTSFNGDLNNRFTNNMWWRVRGYLTADARNQTEYGTVRGYIAIGLSTNTTGGDNAANQFDANRAFIQWAGFTFGRAQSFFDFYSQAAVGYIGFMPNSDTGDGGKEVMGYTAQFGNGFSASLAAEVRRNTQIINMNSVGVQAIAGTVSGGSFSTAGSTVTSFGAYGGWQAPDIVGNLRVDQAWGSAQIGAAAHMVNGTYYSASSSGVTAAGSNTLTPFVEGNGHPSDKWGWAAMAGIRLNTPMIGTGDYLQAQVIYTQGALRYLFQNPGVGNYYVQDNQNVAYGIMSDGIYGGKLGSATNPGNTTTAVQLTTAWGVNASYEHFWNPRWRTSLYGGYAATSYNTLANAMLCSIEGAGTGAGSAAVASVGCDNNWNQWWIGSRTQWNVTKDFYMGVDVAYTKISSATQPGGVTTNTGSAAAPASPLIPANTNTFPRFISDQDAVLVRFRVHRDFYP